MCRVWEEEVFFREAKQETFYKPKSKPKQSKLQEQEVQQQQLQQIQVPKQKVKQVSNDSFDIKDLVKKNLRLVNSGKNLIIGQKLLMIRRYLDLSQELKLK